MEQYKNNSKAIMLKNNSKYLNFLCWFICFILNIFLILEFDVKYDDEGQGNGFGNYSNDNNSLKNIIDIYVYICIGFAGIGILSYCIFNQMLETKRQKLEKKILKHNQDLNVMEEMYIIIFDGFFFNRINGVYCLYLLGLILGQQVHYSFFTITILPILQFIDPIKRIHNDILRNGSKLLWIGLEIIILNYILAFFLYGIYEQDQSDDNKCNNIIDCQFNLLTNIMIQLGSTDSIVPDNEQGGINFSDDKAVQKFFYKIIVFLIFYVFFMALVLSLVIDGLKQGKQERDSLLNLSKNCYACGQSQNSFDKKGKNFNWHINYQHNIWQYIAFQIQLEKQKNEYLTQELQYIKNLILKQDVTWYPFANKINGIQQGYDLTIIQQPDLRIKY